MLKWLLLLIIICFSACRSKELSLLVVKTLHHYPSASAIEFYQDRLFVLGDDAGYLLVLDKDYNPADSCWLADHQERIIPKDQKADFEAMTIVRSKAGVRLLAVSSFSAALRNRLYYSAIPPAGKPHVLPFESIQKKLQAYGINTPNIEGVAMVKDVLVFANRANTTDTVNYLMITADPFLSEVMQLIPVTLPAVKSTVGISGLVYVPERDLLIFTASTEDTPSAYADGTIGDSYLGFFSSFSSRMKKNKITADQMINLQNALKLKGQHKIESVAVESVSEGEMILHLAADNDNGKSSLYKIRWKK